MQSAQHLVLSKMTFDIIDETNYGTFMQKYDKELFAKIQDLEPKLLDERIYIIKASMFPDEKTWM